MATKLHAPSDPEIRLALRGWLSSVLRDDPGCVLVEELGICRGQARVDLAAINGMILGYEIKSDRDSLRRLSGQAELYGRVLDRATLVVGERHLREARELVPKWWGILRVAYSSHGACFKTVRKGRKNPRRDPRSLVELLWLDDALALLQQRDAVRGLRGKPRRIVWDRVCQYFTEEEIGSAVRAKLKARTSLPVVRTQP